VTFRIFGRRYLEAADNRTVTAGQVATCPPAVAEAIMSAVAECEAAATPEAIVARDADKLECRQLTRDRRASAR
jgi:putative hydrolase of HD superfamily